MPVKVKTNHILESGIAHLFLLLIVVLTAFVTFAAIMNRSVDPEQPFVSVLSEEDEMESDEDGRDRDGSENGSSEDKEDEEDSSDDSSDDNVVSDDRMSDDSNGRGGSSDDDQDEFENEDDEDELEGEDEDEDENEIEQEVEVEIENGVLRLKIKYKDSKGNEYEEERKATGSGELATLRIRVKGEDTKLRVRYENGMIVIVEDSEEGEVAALTDLPVNIDPENNRVTVRTRSGEVVVTELPARVMLMLQNSGELDELNKLELKVKQQDGETKVYYHAKGEDNSKLLGLFNFGSEVEAEVDAETGETEITSQPWYLKYLGFLFF